MCSRLGIRQAFSQAHHHQANGRAEVAGKVLQGTLQRLHAQGNINWVEALPRALRIHHDAFDPVMGMSPYQAVFGRNRNLAALPWTSDGESEDARQFFERMARIDTEVARLREEAHRQVTKRVNEHRNRRPPYRIGDYVFMLRPRSLGGVKIKTWWLGPYEIVARIGQDSYQVKIPREGVVDVHATQLKYCNWVQPAIDIRVPPEPMTRIPRFPSMAPTGDVPDQGTVQGADVQQGEESIPRTQAGVEDEATPNDGE